jgi:hypothetical protein
VDEYRGCIRRQEYEMAERQPWRRPSALKLQARLETLTVLEVETVKENRKDSKIYAYWMTSWCEGDKTRNANLGSTRKRDAQAVL